jgi:uncharacterized membrane protein YdjX (TVP38/TMEM64 family)
MKIEHKKIIIFASIIIIGIIIVQYTGLIRFCSLASLQENSDYLRCFVEQRYLFAVLTYIAVYIGLIAASIPCVAPVSMLGGYLFGFWQGVGYSLFATTAGASLSFHVLRVMVGRLHDVRLTPRMEHFKKQLDRYGYLYLLILHFLVMVPFLIINTLAVMAHISWKTFLWTTVLGTLPSVLLYTFAGVKLATIRSIADLFSWPVIFAFTLLIVSITLPLVVRSIKRRKQIK